MSQSDSGTVTTGPAQLWLVYHPDLSDFAVFVTEIEALRFAVKERMWLCQIAEGEPVREQIQCYEDVPALLGQLLGAATNAAKQAGFRLDVIPLARPVGEG